MKIASILGLVAAATLVSADIFTSSEPQLEKNIVPDAFIIQVGLTRRLLQLWVRSTDHQKTHEPKFLPIVPRWL